MAQNFNVPAEDMLQDARTKHALFEDDKADFVAVDADFDDPFADDFEASIDTSEGMEDAETREDQQEQETEEVQAAMQTGGEVYGVAKYFIEKAFPDKPIQRKFGLDNFTEALRNQAKLPLALKNLHTQCEEPAKKALLLAAGMTQAQIDSIETAKNNFKTEDTEQNKFIVETAEATADRDAQYNSTFAFSQKLNRASKVVYAGNIVKMNQYNLPHGSAGADFNVQGKVTDGSNNNAELKGVKVKLTIAGAVPTVLETFTNFAGNWGFEGVPAGNHTLEFSRAGYTTVSNVPFALPAGEKKTVNQTMTLA